MHQWSHWLWYIMHQCECVRIYHAPNYIYHVLNQRKSQGISMAVLVWRCGWTSQYDETTMYMKMWIGAWCIIVNVTLVMIYHAPIHISHVPNQRKSQGILMAVLVKMWMNITIWWNYNVYENVNWCMMYHSQCHIDYDISCTPIHIYHVPNQRKSQGILMAVFLCILLSSGRVLTRTSRHNFFSFPPILEE